MSGPVAGGGLDDFAAIEAAVMETARGRWFLGEYARKMRSADTDVLLAAIARLEQSVGGGHALREIDRIRADLVEMSKAISRTKSEIAALKPDGPWQDRFEGATETLDGVVRTTECATSQILEAAEEMQEAAWTLREHGASEDLCDVLDRRATDIYVACTFQDVTAQRTKRVVRTLRYLEARINAMIEVWRTQGATGDAPRSAVGASLDEGLSQADVDVVIVEESGLFRTPEPGRPLVAIDQGRPAIVDSDLMFLEAPPARERPPTSPQVSEQASQPASAPPSPQLAGQPIAADAFAAVDALDPVERLRRFT